MHSHDAFLAVDAGGTSTRAVVLDSSGKCRSLGRSGPGNPVSSGFELAVNSLQDAIQQAIHDSEKLPENFHSVTLAIAGGSTQLPLDRLTSRFSKLGLTGKIVIDSDLLATYCAGTYHSDGYALVAGTGAVCARVKNFSLDRVVDGTGWLLGDGGSGYWIGYHVARAVAADLDGRALSTGMTPLLAARLGLLASSATFEGRPVQLQELIRTVYHLRPIELASFATIAFEAAAAQDAVALGILRSAGTALAHSLSAAQLPEVDGPVVLGGSILSVDSVIVEELATGLSGREVFKVPDGLAGAASLALRHGGVQVDQQIFETIKQSLSMLRGR
ncbi:N-acetylglucosamine kinase [Psychromicrobium sp. YIM B11713]|uniref:N-acetylglucosamine kinase n=1 Tax=Psychromicrobium sp. YIM B11713 TaxID=3145233 RepID=UPI00374EC2AC